MILFQCTCGFHHKFGEFSVILLTLLVVSFTRLYSSIAFNLVTVKRTLLGSFDTSCVCQSGYEIVEEGLLNLKHLITRSWK